MSSPVTSVFFQRCYTSATSFPGYGPPLVSSRRIADVAVWLTETVFETATFIRLQPPSIRQQATYSRWHPSSTSPRSTSNSQFLLAICSPKTVPRNHQRSFSSPCGHIFFYCRFSFTDIYYLQCLYSFMNLVRTFAILQLIGLSVHDILKITSAHLAHSLFDVTLYPVYAEDKLSEECRPWTRPSMKNVTVRRILLESVIQEIENMMGHMTRYNFDDCNFWLIRGKIIQFDSREPTCDESTRERMRSSVAKANGRSGCQSWILPCRVNISVAK